MILPISLTSGMIQIETKLFSAIYLSTWQRVARDKSWEALETKPELASPRWSTDDLLLAGLELLNVPGGKHELALQEASLGGSEPDEEVGWKRDYARGRSEGGQSGSSTWY